ncbi:MAG TPA: methenyltetrahydromethanopterin cyclohydrolase [Rhodopila sp.]|nr:methenyltetrahydromethanopterin cyclohydrolase [Rhodopila sp.]
MNQPTDLGLNDRAWGLVEALAAEAASLRVGVGRGDAGERVIDAGTHHPGGIAAGLLLARICLGGLGEVRLATDPLLPRWPWTIVVSTQNPVPACLASQYAGWSLSHGKGKGAFFALGSGPARALARKEPLFAELGYQEAASHAVLVLESGKPPPAALVKEIAASCGVEAASLAILYAPTQSLAGGVQVVARVLEVALHKAHTLQFPLSRIVDGLGAAPLPPPHPDFVLAMGRTNDAIIFGGRVHLFVTGPADEARGLAQAMPAATSHDYGKPFAEIFRAAKGDFYAIDPMLFSPASVTVTAIETGDSFFAGSVDPALLDASFGGSPA